MKQKPPVIAGGFFIKFSLYNRIGIVMIPKREDKMKNFSFLLTLILFVSPSVWGQKPINTGVKVAEALSTTPKVTSNALKGISLTTPAGYQTFCTRVGLLKNRLGALGGSITKLQEGSEPASMPPNLNKQTVRTLGIIQAEKLLEQAHNSMVLSPKEKALRTETLQQYLIEAERKIKQVTLSYLRLRQEYASLLEMASEQLPQVAEKGTAIYASRQNENIQLAMVQRNVFSSLPIEPELQAQPFEFYGEDDEIISSLDVRPLEQFVVAGISTELPWVLTFENLSLEDFAVYAYLRERLEKSYEAWAKHEDDAILLQQGAYSMLFRNEKTEFQDAYSQAMEDEMQAIYASIRTAQADLLELVDFVSQHPQAFKPLINSWLDFTTCDTPLARNIRRMLENALANL